MSSGRADRARERLEFLQRQVASLEALAESSAGGESPQSSAAVSARAKAAELQKQIEQLRDWVGREPSWKRGSGHGKKPTALILLAAGRSSTEVAAELGVDRRTVNRWRADPEFDEQLRELQAAQSDAVHALMVAEQLEVMRCLVALATGPDTQDMARAVSIRTFFELLGKHKGAPVTPPLLDGEIETEEEVAEAIKDIPDALLRRVLEQRQAERASAAAKKSSRRPAKDL